MRKAFCGRGNASSSGSGTLYHCLANLQIIGANREQKWLQTGQFLNLRVELTAAPGGGCSRVFTLYINGSATALTLTLSGAGSGSGITFATSGILTASITKNDTVQLRQVVTGAAAVSFFKWSIEFEGAVAKESMHGGFTSAGFAGSTSYFNPLSTLDSTTNDPGSANTATMEGITPIDGTIKEWSIQLGTAPGGSASRTFVLVYRAPGGSAVVQDGTGGSVDTSFTISGSNTSGSKSGFVLDVEPDGEVWARQTPASAPTSAGISFCSLLFEADVDGYAIWANDNPTFSTVNDDDYMSTPGNVAWSTTESDMEMVGPITEVTLGPLYVKYNTTSTRTLKLRTNGIDSTMVASVSADVRSNDTTHPVTLDSTDTWDWRDDDVGGGFRALIWAVASYIAPPPAAMQVTQLAVLVFIDETADEDIPDEATPCSGGGTVATGSNPSAGASLASATHPEFYLEIDIGGASPNTLRIAKGAWSNSTIYLEPMVLSWSDLTRSIVDADYRHQTAYIEVTLADPTGVIRGPMDELWSGASSSDAIVDRPARLYGHDQANPGTAQLLFQGVIRSAAIDDTVVKLSIEDALSTKTLSVFSDEMLVPKTLITSVLTDATPLEEMLDKAIPLAYGSLSDEAEGDDAKGVVPGRYVKTEDGWDWHLFCLGAVKNIQSVFGADFLSSTVEPTISLKLPDSAWGDWALAPHKAGWLTADDWFEVGGKRYTMVLLDHAHIVARMAREGRLPLSANLCGYESVGDGSGTMIDSLENIFLHFLINFVWGDYDGTGDWETSVPALGSYSAIDTTSFSTSATAAGAMLSGGVKGAVLLAHSLQQERVLDTLARFCRNGGFEYFINQYGQFSITRLDRTADASAVTARTALEHIIKGSFKITPSRDQQIDLVPYVHTPNYLPTRSDLNPSEGAVLPKDPYKSNYASGLQLYDTGTGGTKRAPVQEYDMLRSQTIAEFVATQYGDTFSKPRLVAQWMERMTGLSLEIGSVAKVTNYKGTGTTGWSNRRVQIRKEQIQLNARNALCTARDVDDLLA